MPQGRQNNIMMAVIENSKASKKNRMRIAEDVIRIAIAITSCNDRASPPWMANR